MGSLGIPAATPEEQESALEVFAAFLVKHGFDPAAEHQDVAKIREKIPEEHKAEFDQGVKEGLEKLD